MSSTPKKDLNGMFGCTEMTMNDKEYHMLEEMRPHVQGHFQTLHMFGNHLFLDGLYQWNLWSTYYFENANIINSKKINYIPFFYFVNTF